MGTSPNLLLINPWIYDFSAYDLWSKPVGLLYVAACLRSLGYRIHLLDCLDRHDPDLLKFQGRTGPKIKKYGTGPFHRQIVEKPPLLDFMPRHYARYGLPEELFLKKLNHMSQPDAVLVTSLMTYWYPGPQRVVELVRQTYPGVPVILGGIYATLMPEHARQVVKPDYIIQGAGEIQAAHLLNDVLSYQPVSQNHPEVLDDFPYPAFDLYPHPDYLIVMTSRGCPYRCTFCATAKISGAFAQRKPEKVVEEILQQTRRFKIKDVAFYDDALLLNKKNRIIPVLKQLIKSRTRLRFHAPNGLHVREIDRELAQFVHRANFTTIRLSFESVNPGRLSDMKNKVTPADLETAVCNLEKAGYRPQDVEAYVLMGLPKQSREEVFESLFFVHSLGIKVRLASFSPIPGTVDYQRAVTDGLFPHEADPLLTNKSIYPLFRTAEAYHKFHAIRHLARILNEGVDRGVNLFGEQDLRNALRRALPPAND